MNAGGPKGFNKNLKESRKSNRYPIEADVLIVCGSFNNKMKSLDVSAGGLHLKAALPADLVGKDIQVTVTYLTSKKVALSAHGTCRLVPKALNRLELVDPLNGFQGFLDEIWE